MKLKTKFQDEDFELGEVVEVIIDANVDGTIELTAWPEKGGAVSIHHESLAELTKYWEDYEEPKELWFIAHDGSICSSRSDLFTKEWQKLGLTFETKEEAEKAVEKLMAITRLQSKGFKFVEYQLYDVTEDGGDGYVNFEFKKPLDKSDLDLLFGGEE